MNKFVNKLESFYKSRWPDVFEKLGIAGCICLFISCVALKCVSVFYDIPIAIVLLTTLIPASLWIPCFFLYFLTIFIGIPICAIENIKEGGDSKTITIIGILYVITLLILYYM